MCVITVRLPAGASVKPRTARSSAAGIAGALRKLGSTASSKPLPRLPQPRIDERRETGAAPASGRCLALRGWEEYEHELLTLAI
jgi:hypothetical protein